jgi:hypothetical protein
MERVYPDSEIRDVAWAIDYLDDFAGFRGLERKYRVWDWALITLGFALTALNIVLVGTNPEFWPLNLAGALFVALKTQRIWMTALVRRGIWRELEQSAREARFVVIPLPDLREAGKGGKI